MNGKTVGKIAGNVLEACLVTAAVSLVGIALLALISLKGALGNGAENIGLTVIRILSCFLGGFLCARKNKRRGFLWGLLVGVLYFGLLLLLHFLSGGGEQNLLQMATVFLCCAGSGMLGGMFSW